MSSCRKCHKELEQAWKVCPFCGTKVVRAPQAKHRGNGMGGVYKRGNTWTARVTVGWDAEGTPIRKTKGGFATRTDAMRYIEKLKENPMAPRKADSFAKMFERFADFYEERIKSSTMATYKAAFKHLKPIHHRVITEITTPELQDCIDKCGCGRSTLDDMRTVISLTFKFAAQNHIKVDNPAQYLYTGAKKKGTRDAFSAEELERIKHAVGIEPYAVYVICMCYLGFRPGEMLALKKEVYDREHCCLVGGGKTKAGTNRIVTISPKIQLYIERQMQTPGEYLFPKQDGTRMSDSYFRDHCFNPLMERLHINQKVPYSCRHTFANLLKAVSGSDTDKAALIGHADASMTHYYQSADYESLKAITDAI